MPTCVGKTIEYLQYYLFHNTSQIQWNLLFFVFSDHQFSINYSKNPSIKSCWKFLRRPWWLFLFCFCFFSMTVSSRPFRTQELLSWLLQQPIYACSSFWKCCLHHHHHPIHSLGSDSPPPTPAASHFPYLVHGHLADMEARRLEASPYYHHLCLPGMCHTACLPAKPGRKPTPSVLLSLLLSHTHFDAVCVCVCV